MKRIVFVWLPLWPIERMRSAQPALVPDNASLALVETGVHGIRITAATPHAAAKGVRIGQALADARAVFPDLLTQAADPCRDRSALVRLARWCGRYGPNRNIDGEDGIWIDITGVAHLYGGEAALLADLAARLARFSLTARLGLADTLGAAHALARFAPSSPAIAAEGRAEENLARLPVEALRLTPQSTLLLKRLGLSRIGNLYRLPRAALERRFRSAKGVEAVLARLDQALGVRAEPCRPLVEPPALYVQRSWPEPLIASEQLEAETTLLAKELCTHLAARHLGARRIALSLYRADGSIAEARAGLSAPTWSPEHMAGLIIEKLAALDAGFGVDVMVLAAVQVEKLTAQQEALGARLQSTARTDAAQLVDRLTNRLGVTRVSRLVARGSHIPERAEVRVPALAAQQEDIWPPATGPTPPPLLLPSPEPIRVVAEVPEGPPARFTWRRVERRIVRAEGPKRLAPEWWDEIATKKSGTRDYYRVEDEGGAGYWVFREGLYGRGEEDMPRWFLHGLFG
ncbi:MAG: DNA polymerase Y family protein [Hyphomicrobium sp.]|jgi:protein ImuB